MANFVMASTDKHYPNEANPSFNDLTETNISNIEEFFTNPVISCPNNITVTAAAGANSKNVSWSSPSATTPCVVSSGQSCSNDNISGFKYLGKRGNSKYYCSDTDNFTYWEAKQKAEIIYLCLMLGMLTTKYYFSFIHYSGKETHIKKD